MLKRGSIFVCGAPVDFRRAVDGLCALIIEHFESQPQQGIYVFYNKNKNRLKILLWHHNGFMLIYKRMEKGRFPFIFSSQGNRILLEENQLQGLLLGLDWQRISDWKDINFESYF
ncbi:MAG: IS66 family insertion sequence element accessory protein TnpB [Bacteroidia bacterium]|jgi:transposase